MLAQSITLEMFLRAFGLLRPVRGRNVGLVKAGRDSFKDFRACNKYVVRSRTI